MLTFGGLPIEQALHWTPETTQRLGRVVGLVMSGNREKALKGYTEFYQLKRQFEEGEFNAYVSLLDLHREGCGHVSLTDMLITISNQIVKHGAVVDVAEQPIMPLLPPSGAFNVARVNLPAASRVETLERHPPARNAPPEPCPREESVEQMSLVF